MKSKKEIALAWKRVKADRQQWLRKQMALPFSDPRRPSQLVIKSWQEVLDMKAGEHLSKWMNDFIKKYPYEYGQHWPQRDNPKYLAVSICLAKIVKEWESIRNTKVVDY